MEESALICFFQASLQELLNNEITAFKMERFGHTIAGYLICCYEERLISFVTQTPKRKIFATVGATDQIYAITTPSISRQLPDVTLLDHVI